MGKSLADRKLEAEILQLEAKARYDTAAAAEAEIRLGGQVGGSQLNRVYPFWSLVDEDSVYHCVEQLGIWTREGVEPITIEFNSAGGSVIDGLALYDTILRIRDAGVTVNTSSVGMSASMAGILLQAGDERVMSANGFLLIHEVSAGAYGKASLLKDAVKFSERLQDRCLAILAERSTLTVAEIASRWERRDWWLGADEALELGFVDAIR